MHYKKFETIKKHARDCFTGMAGGRYGTYIDSEAPMYALYSSICEPYEKPRDVLDQWIDHGITLIDRWDIRCVAKLIELFPGCVPEYYDKKKISCDMDDSGDWCVVFGT